MKSVFAGKSLLTLLSILLFAVHTETSFAQNTNEIKKWKELKHRRDDKGTVYKLYRGFYYRETSCPLEFYDSLKAANPDTKEYACYFKIKGKKNYISDIKPRVFYECNWMIPEVSYIDKNRIFVCLEFMSGNNSLPDIVCLYIDRNTCEIEVSPFLKNPIR